MLTTPLITLLFSVVFYAVGYQGKGGDVLISRSAVVFASGQDDSAIVAGTVGIFSPRRTSNRLNLRDPDTTGDECHAGGGAGRGRGRARSGSKRRETRGWTRKLA